MPNFLDELVKGINEQNSMPQGDPRKDPLFALGMVAGFQNYLDAMETEEYWLMRERILKIGNEN